MLSRHQMNNGIVFILQSPWRHTQIHAQTTQVTPLLPSKMSLPLTLDKKKCIPEKHRERGGVKGKAITISTNRQLKESFFLRRLRGLALELFWQKLGRWSPDEWAVRSSQRSHRPSSFSLFSFLCFRCVVGSLQIDACLLLLMSTSSLLFYSPTTYPPNILSITLIVVCCYLL